LASNVQRQRMTPRALGNLLRNVLNDGDAVEQAFQDPQVRDPPEERVRWFAERRSNPVRIAGVALD